ncbi:2-oxoglutarate dehydrogenase E2 component (dihydrolipoamide succinyltransferase) [Pullulanibacillus pueri]|uniref:Dihydrolipoyllysine-residue succinyltransferase component of 2-oxoglutarate dehydrogenase complex n=1 Tax=Pullulanibacillus pueri TaxID=1437324 RepID=A0A8J3ESP9_9BACL|nr:2-oxoglutarate dehydrogenase complex dihydrolipoyllysine-residue succinyltransferase [Pullulanibacillus pueri]MBM7684225.1 2-oxoglutarate dehydrogenase E2 component (dihydrolipoamide succinyltransferase) [Pullulanibacillus pueri]GGH89015.1 dihydrolipoyllysine-residue succinyltransferase component of 2-oxoglutarate dehydrogenase complex [Pullulanibacillus pueri]
MVDVKVPELAESITEGTIAKWLKNVGDKVNKGDDIVELETDKVNVQISAEDEGVLTELKKEEGDTVEVGEIIAVLDPNAEAGAAPAAPSAEPKADDNKAVAESTPVPEKEEVSSANGERYVASPAVRKLARELGVDLKDVSTNDPLGRIHGDDVKRAAQPAPKAAEKPAAKSVDENPAKPVERIKMSRRRQTIANRLVDVQHTAAMLTTFNEVDMTAIMDLRKRRKDSFLEKHDVKLGFMSFFTKAVVGALKEFPLLNAEIQGTELLVKKFYDIGIAVSTDEGLVVPVVRDADRLGFAGIESEIGNLAKKARDGKLTLSDLSGGTFTITNGGTFGSLLSTPILNAPQVGILGMHSIQWRPVAIDKDRMENRPMMYLALSYDHRIVDGSEAVRFLVSIKQKLEDPETLLLEG